MANHTLDNVMIYDGSYLATGCVIDPGALRLLATAFCDDTSYHDLSFSGSHVTKRDNDDFERQKEFNKGYCNRCAEHAAFILSRFNITEREVQR